MKVLITGGMGYLGGRLAQHLSELECSVILGTRRATNSPAWLPQAKVVRTQWDSLDDLKLICKGVDAVVHAAGMNAEDCATDPMGALAFNGLATARLLEAAVSEHVTRFLYVSTAHVYRAPLAGTITEETCPVNVHPYATSHHAGENAVQHAQRRGLIEGVVLRLSNSFGAPAHKNARCWNLVINDLCHQAVTRRKMALKTSGLQRRNFVPMTEICRAIEHFLYLPKEKTAAGLFNMGSDWSPTVWEAASLVRERCEALFGFTPMVTRISPKPEERSDDLDYRIDALYATGFVLGSRLHKEIDRMLAYCEMEKGADLLERSREAGAPRSFS